MGYNGTPYYKPIGTWDGPQISLYNVFHWFTKILTKDATVALSSIAGGMKSVRIFTLIVNGFVSIVWNSQNCHFVRRKDNLKGTIERPLESRAVK